MGFLIINTKEDAQNQFQCHPRVEGRAWLVQLERGNKIRFTGVIVAHCGTGSMFPTTTHLRHAKTLALAHPTPIFWFYQLVDRKKFILFSQTLDRVNPL